MNILFDCHTFDVGPQGTTTFLAGLVNALPDAADAPSQPLAITCAAHDPRSVSRFVHVPHAFEPMTGGFFQRNMLSIPRLTAVPGVDAVVSQYVRPFRSRVPTVSVIHDVLFLDFPELFGWRYRQSRRVLFGWSARNSDVVITVSKYSRSRIAHHFGISPDRIDILPNAVDVTTDVPVGCKASDDSSIKLLFVSRFERRKRHHWCVAAARALAAKGMKVELTLVGHATGAYAEEVRAAIASGGTDDTVSIDIRSDVSESELSRMFMTTDLFLFPSECEGFGIPVIEAAAHGVPCVVASNTAMTELADQYSGIAVSNPGEGAFVEAVAVAVERLPDLKAVARRKAVAVRQRYRWDQIARDFLAILDRRGVAR